MADRQHQQKHFIEEGGLAFEKLGLPRMAGRVLGWLLVANPPHQSHKELAEVLAASKGSISTTTRMLIQVGLVERVSLPGDRLDYFRIKLGAWSSLMEQRMGQISAIRQLAERGLELVDRTNSEQCQRLQEMYDLHAFFEQQWPQLLDNWQQKRQQQLQSDSLQTHNSPTEAVNG